MVRKISEFIEPYLHVAGIILFVVFLAAIGGCLDKKPEQPLAAKPPEVSVADTAAIPDILCLRSGQSAVLLEDMIAKARIPATGDALYEGEVRFDKGTVLLGPVKE